MNGFCNYVGPGPNISYGGNILPLLLGFLGMVLCFLRIVFGIMRRKKMWIIIVIVIALIVSGGIFAYYTMYVAPSAEMPPKVIVIGMDGLDPKILERMMAEGKLPNFLSLKNTGCYHRLSTTNPAQSPVAWSTFATGTNPGGHGIFDFLRRNPDSYMPTISLVQSANYATMGKYKFRLRGARVSCSRKGTPFWRVTSDAKIPTTVLRCPVTFPPDKVYGKMLSGMGVLDLSGAHGAFSWYTNDSTRQQTQLSGNIIQVETGDDTIQSTITGPRNPFSRPPMDTQSPLKIKLDRTNKQVTITLNGKSRTIGERQWSDWFEVKFNIAPLRYATGICRFYLKEINPAFGLYLSPINYDPRKPEFPISYPASYSKRLVKKIGLYHTLGMPEDTWSLNEGLMDEDTYLEECYHVLAERQKMLFTELAEFKKGLFVCVIDTPDRIQHMFWRFLDKKHPMYDEELAKRYKEVIPDCYKKMDGILGNVLDVLPNDTTLIVLSDHGFGTFRRVVHINEWFHKEGYAEPKPSSIGVFSSEPDWEQTRSYAMGFGGIYINQKGRESRGMLESGAQTKELKAEIARRLEELTDPDTHEKVIHKVYAKEEVFHGPYTGEAPDLFVGFNTGYRASWQTALGGAGPTGVVVEDNLKKWSGDHCFDPSFVPGVFLSNRSVNTDNPRIMDVAPTILKLLNTKIPEEMEGKPLM
jgi:predicted AlkP superfamily phosphohydrolase/phosphomutase